MIFVKKSIFSLYVVFSQKSQKETFFYILDSKECFLDLKSEFLAKSKKSTFCKGVSPWFFSKNRPFSYKCFFEQKARKKHFLIFCIENKVYWTSKVKFSQSQKKTKFCKEVSPWVLSKIRPFSHLFFLGGKKGRKKHFLLFWIEKNAF